MDQKNLYEILNCSHNASAEELKNNYQLLIKQYHPDKVHGQQASGVLFQQIDGAWKILRDPELRKQYDASLMQTDLNEQPLIYAEVDVNELMFNDDCISYYPCRCGSNFVINKLDVHKYSIIECSECTNCIHLKSCCRD